MVYVRNQGLIQKIMVGGAKQAELDYGGGGGPSRCTVHKAMLPF